MSEIQTEPTQVAEAFAPPAGEPTTPEEVGQRAVTETPSEPEPSPAASEALTYEAWQAQLDAHPELKAAHEERETERTETQRKELRKEEYRKLQGAIQPAIDQWAQNSGAVRQGIEQISSTIQNAVADGTLDANTAAKVLGAYNPQLYFEGSYWILDRLGATVEDESFANEFLGRINRMAQGKPDPDFATDVLKRLVEPTTERGYVPRSKYDADVKKAHAEGRQAALNDIAARERGDPDRNPDMALKGAGGSKLYSRMTREERSKLTPQEIDRLVAQETGG